MRPPLAESSIELNKITLEYAFEIIQSEGGLKVVRETLAPTNQLLSHTETFLPSIVLVLAVTMPERAAYLQKNANLVTHVYISKI